MADARWGCVKSTFIDGKPETQWAMEQVTRIFGFKSIAEVKATLKYDDDGIATIVKDGLKIIGTTNQKAWATLRISWAGVGVMRREAAIEYSQRYLNERSA